MASTLEKLVSLQQRRIQTVQEAPSTSVDAVTDDELISSGPLLSPDDTEVASITSMDRNYTTAGGQLSPSLREVCLKEQLDSLYADLEYLSKSFPSLTIRSLVDLAVRSGLADHSPSAFEAESSDAVFQENGIIPALVMRDLEKITEESAAQLLVGAIEVDEQGRLLWMNDESRRILGIATVKAPGSYFFTELVPGANNGLFYGRFQQGVEQAVLDVEFHYALTYKMSPAVCVIHMIRSPRLGRYFVFIKQVEG